MQNLQFDYQRTMTMDKARSQASTIFLAKVFNWMAIGLAITAGAAFLVASSVTAQQIIFGNSLVFYGMIIGELGLVYYLSARVQRLSAQASTGIFIGYALLNGLTLSAILLLYTKTSIAATFLITAGMFGAMAVYGMVTKRDLSGLGSFLMMGLFGIIIASIVNLFLGSPMISWVVSGIGVIVFTGLTAYDVQKISQIGAYGIMENGEAVIHKTAIMGALALYLDFINLFLMLLHFFSGSRE